MIGRGGLPGVDPSRRMFEELPELEVFIVCTSPVSRTGTGPAAADFTAEAVMVATVASVSAVALAALPKALAVALITGCGACKNRIWRFYILHVLTLRRILFYEFHANMMHGLLD